METTLPMLVDLFLATKQTEGLSAKTIRGYRQILGRFTEFAGRDKTVRDLSIDLARQYVASLQEQDEKWSDHPTHPAKKGKLKTSTIHAHIRAIKTFGSWLVADNYVRSDPFARLKRPKIPETVIEILSDEEIDRIFASINPRCQLGARLQLVMLLLLDTGMRASELCSLKLQDVHLKEGYVKVFGKMSKERIIPFGATTKKALLEYIHTWRQPAHEGIEELILSVDGQPLGYSGLGHMIQRLGKRVDIPRLHAHLLRHCFAIKYLIAGGDLVSLKLMLGHTSVSVTQIYLKLAQEHVAVQHRRFSFVDNLALSRRASITKTRRVGYNASTSRIGATK